MVGELHSVRVLRFLKVLVGVPADVAAASDVSADQTNPEILLHSTLEALVLLHWLWCLTVPTNGTRGIFPPLETLAVKAMVAQSGEDAIN